MNAAEKETAPVEAEWALWGKEARDSEYRLLRCSAGALSRQDFGDLIYRYSPGTLDSRNLPQVTASSVPAGIGPGGVAVAIHETAAADPVNRSAHDRGGRPIVYTRYFCVSYSGLAARGDHLPGHDRGVPRMPTAAGDSRSRQGQAAELSRVRTCPGPRAS